jgi:hypothetical protein
VIGSTGGGLNTNTSNTGSSYYLNGGNNVHYNPAGELVIRPGGGGGLSGGIGSGSSGLDYQISGGGGGSIPGGLHGNVNFNPNVNITGGNDKSNFANSSRIQSGTHQQNFVITGGAGGNIGTNGGSDNLTATQLVNQVINSGIGGGGGGGGGSIGVSGGGQFNNDRGQSSLVQHHHHHHQGGLGGGGSINIGGGLSGGSINIGGGGSGGSVNIGSGGGKVTGTLGTAGGVSQVTSMITSSGGVHGEGQQAAHSPLISTTTVANNITQTSASSSIVRGAAKYEDKSYFADRSKSDTIGGIFYFRILLRRD